MTPGPNPVPVLNSLSQARRIAGSASLALTVNGSGFTLVVCREVERGQSARRHISARTQLQASLGAGDLAVVGSAQVSVFSPSPGGGTSSVLNLTLSHSLS